MAGRWWMTVALVFLLSAGSLTAVDPNKLAKLITSIKNQYNFSGMFCLAVGIGGKDQNDLQKILSINSKASVDEALNKGDVYKDNRLVVAKVKPPEHAEYRVLKDLQLDSDKDDLLVIYSYASSCPTTCTNINNPYNIINLIRGVINKRNFSEYAFVFEKIFKPKGKILIKDDKLIKALEALGESGITLANIFRCYNPKEHHDIRCISCSNNGEVAKQCVDYDE